MTPHSWIVIYQRPDKSYGEELTTNVPLTVSVLEAQGIVIIDIVDGG